MCEQMLKEYPQLQVVIKPAPNRYRKVGADIALQMQKDEWPDLAEKARGVDMCFMCFDEILVWNK